jgi:hypothetical protein
VEIRKWEKQKNIIGKRWVDFGGDRDECYVAMYIIIIFMVYFLAHIQE